MKIYNQKYNSTIKILRLDAAIIFSDILMIHAMNRNVKFKKILVLLLPMIPDETKILKNILKF